MAQPVKSDFTLTRAEMKRVDAFLRKHDELPKKGKNHISYGRNKRRDYESDR